jgi:hypothetical protein
MTSDERLRRELRASVTEQVEPVDPDFEVARRRGTFLRRRKWWVTSGFVGVVLIGALAAASSLQSPFARGSTSNADAASEISDAARHGDARNDQRGGAAQDTSVERVAAYSVRAVAQADLLQPYGQFYDYKSVERADTGWYVNFVAAECFRTVQVETCNRIAQGNPPRLHVELVGNRFAIIQAEGPMNAEQRARLLAYTEEANEEPVGWEFPAVALKDSLSDKATTDVKASGLWTGPIPSSGSAEDCVLKLFDDTGHLVTTEHLPERTPPTMEDERAGSFVQTSVPSQLQASRAEIECT